MKKFLSAIAALIMILSCAFALAACGDSGPSADNSSKNSSGSDSSTIVLTPSENLQFDLNDGGDSYAVTGIGSETSHDIVIPSTHEGKPVTAIGREAFRDHVLVSLYIPESITSIGDWVMGDNNKLESITVSADNAKYHSSGNCLIETQTKTLVLGCKNSVIPSDDSVTSIGTAFGCCEGLTSIVIPASVKTIGTGAFDSCTRLSSVTFGENSGLEEIGINAFHNCEKLENIVLPDGVKTIGDQSFDGCSKLNSVTLGSGLTSIGRNAFGYCTALKTITFKGSSSQWQAVEKGENWNQLVPSDCVISYAG